MAQDVHDEFARIGNEGLAELVRDHPDRFAGFCACVALNDVDRALEEIDYAFDELGAALVDMDQRRTLGKSVVHVREAAQ